ncbi:hypothetical protein ACTD5D_09765 [Nocardia takedensis]|uniref:hypothetical protein n=1 Tax=Nocardia takedensis TaxID=259390 RepID=UPI003F7643ED
MIENTTPPIWCAYLPAGEQGTDHLDLLDPGLVHPNQWHTATTDPDTAPPQPDRSPGPTEPALFHAALAAKPHP